SGAVLVVDVRAAQVTDTIRGFGLPYRMAIAPNGRVAVVSDPVKSQIRVFDAATHHERFLIDVPKDSVLSTGANRQLVGWRWLLAHRAEVGALAVGPTHHPDRPERG